LSQALRTGGLTAALVLGLLATQTARAEHVNVIEIKGVISAATADFVERALAESEEQGAVALLIAIDTPGGVLEPTKFIVQSLLNAQIPTIVYVSPQGAWAASAGTFITMAGHVAAMAPGTSIGAASPVGGGTSEDRDEDGKRTDVMGQKIENFTSAFIEAIADERDRNVEWAAQAVREAVAVGADEAVELDVVDLVARDREELFEKISGMQVMVDGEPRTLQLVGLEVREIERTGLERVFDFIANPNVAMFLMMGAMLGLMLEFNSPGIFIPGAIGLGCLVLAVFAFDLLPFSYLGLVLIAVGIGLMVAELFVSSFGVLFAGGVVCFIAGGAMLFDVPEVSDVKVDFWPVLMPMAAALALVGGAGIYAIGRTFKRAQTAGVSELIGLVGRADTQLAPDGRVFVRGEYWNARGDETIPAETAVQVTAVEGMLLRVRRAQAKG
jgi:membrane-bound serine protease (ClpP class)